jgi:hypothetical protein
VAAFGNGRNKVRGGCIQFFGGDQHDGIGGAERGFVHLFQVSRCESGLGVNAGDAHEIDSGANTANGLDGGGANGDDGVFD